jgi:hypothetical protein
MLLPSSVRGFDFDYFGARGDGVDRLWLDSNFDNVLSVTVTSINDMAVFACEQNLRQLPAF